MGTERGASRAKREKVSVYCAELRRGRSNVIESSKATGAPPGGWGLGDPGKQPAGLGRGILQLCLRDRSQADGDAPRRGWEPPRSGHDAPRHPEPRGCDWPRQPSTCPGKRRKRAVSRDTAVGAQHGAHSAGLPHPRRETRRPAGTGPCAHATPSLRCPWLRTRVPCRQKLGVAGPRALRQGEAGSPSPSPPDVGSATLPTARAAGPGTTRDTAGCPPARISPGPCAGLGGAESGAGNAVRREKEGPHPDATSSALRAGAHAVPGAVQGPRS